MAELDNLIGSRITLISQVDVRYDGVLFSINSKEASIVLREVKCHGTEDRVSDPAKKVAPSSVSMPFVSFPGQDIKDLYVHEGDATSIPEAMPVPQPPVVVTAVATTPPAPPAAPIERTGGPGRGPGRGSGRGRGGGGGGRGNTQGQGQVGPATAAGTGEHLLRMWEKRGPAGAAGASQPGDNITKSSVQEDFDISGALARFDKVAILAEVQDEKASLNKVEAVKYSKDNFFDNLSCDLVDRAEGRHTRMSNQTERHLNQDTFGAIALQSSNYRGYNGGRGHRGYGRSSGGGRGRSNGGGYGYGRGGGGGRGQSQNLNSQAAP